MPRCGAKFKVVLTASSFVAVVFASVIAAATPAVVVFFLVHNFWYMIGAYVFFIVAVVMPIDRWFDNNIRPTKPVDEKK